MSTSTVDWLTFRSRSNPHTVMRALTSAIGEKGHSAGLDYDRPGWQGYRDGGAIRFGDMRIGQWGSGGDNQKGWSTFQVDGSGCGWLTDWDRTLEELANLDAFQPRRVDLAVDTYAGEVTHHHVVKAHEAGRFTTRGRPPDLMRYETTPRHRGWSCEIGKRASAKFLRCYEKGYEQCKKHGIDATVVHEIDGHSVRDWYRVELELKAKDGQALPEDLIGRRDEYFGGAYPFCRDLVEAQPFQLQRSPHEGPQRDLRRVLSNIQAQYGRSLFTALVAFEGDIGAVWDRIVGDRHNPALVDAGVLMVDHLAEPERVPVALPTGEYCR